MMMAMIVENVDNFHSTPVNVCFRALAIRTFEDFSHQNISGVLSIHWNTGGYDCLACCQTDAESERQRLNILIECWYKYYGISTPSDILLDS